MLKVLKGQTRTRAWQSEDLLAVQIPGRVEDLPENFRRIVENKDANYRRDHAPEEGLAIAVVNAKDIVEPSDLDDRSATCWIKMSEVSVEGLRQAFLDPGSRIRLNPKEGELEPEEHAELVALAWEGGFLDGPPFTSIPTSTSWSAGGAPASPRSSRASAPSSPSKPSATRRARRTKASYGRS